MSTSQPEITITASAAEHIRKMLQAEPSATGLRLSVKKMGCSGFSYVPVIATAQSGNDVTLSTEHGFNLLWQASDFAKLDGLSIDYVQKDIANAQLMFDHPKASSVCGCGESFTFEESADGK